MSTNWNMIKPRSGIEEQIANAMTRKELNIIGRYHHIKRKFLENNRDYEKRLTRRLK
jgi:hypothetical protein